MSDAIICTRCKWRITVSNEDPDASMEDALDHVVLTHVIEPNWAFDFLRIEKAVLSGGTE